MSEELSLNAREFIDQALRQEGQVTPEMARSIRQGVLGCVAAASAATALGAPTTAAASVMAGAAALPAGTAGAAGTAGSVMASILAKAGLVSWLVAGIAVGSVTTGVVLWVAPRSPATRAGPPAHVSSSEIHSVAVPRRDARTAPQLDEPEPARLSRGHGDAPTRAEPAPGPPPNHDRATEATHAPAKDSASIAAELALLEKAQDALRTGSGAAALELLDRPQQRPAVFVDERLTIEMLAACQMGNRDRARRAADRLIARSPQSPLALRARHSCAFESDTPTVPQ
jgi:hypothetical protein